MKKSIPLMIVLIISLITGCGQSNSKVTSNGSPQNAELKVQTTITVVAPKSPATIPILRMIEGNCMGDKIKIDLQLYSDMETMMAMASEGDYGILIVPAHTAANLNNKGVDVKLLNVFNWGGMCLSTTDSDCNSWEDLAGKELYVPSKGSVPEILTQYFLKQNGLAVGENIEVVYSSHNEIAQLLSVGTIKYAVDAQPFVTSNTNNVLGYKVISEFSEEWRLTQGEEYSMPANCMVSSNEYLSKNEELINSFNKKFSEAVEWTVENPAEAGALASANLNANAELIAEAMQGFGFDYQSAVDSQKDLEQYYNVLLEMKPESIGGTIPNKEFYHLQK
ncbi:ABC transporter substrate-binding protein [Anaerotignum sp.]|uniref:ABC transporter substrate-binding protein n=1 Tax=Anaerotignum sp. TaxID=2039241 RepID=UPI0027151FF2|nr:PhnD/SsuA/transferrin family substrate-binding protein [Anaerotignum sp.]